MQQDKMEERMERTMVREEKERTRADNEEAEKRHEWRKYGERGVTCI